MDNGTIKVGSDPSKMPRKPQKEKLLRASPKRMAVAQKISVDAALRCSTVRTGCWYKGYIFFAFIAALSLHGNDLGGHLKHLPDVFFVHILTK